MTDGPGELRREEAAAPWRAYAAGRPAGGRAAPPHRRSLGRRRRRGRPRAGWLGSHLRYSTRTPAARGEPWDDGLEVVSERFRVVWPPEVADPA